MASLFAIELAASRVRSLSVTEVLNRLDDRFRLLTRGRHGGVEHHQTLRATVDWSYQLLSDAERALFVRLSVFPGGFDLAAVEAVCADEMLDQSAIVDLIDALVAKSMVVADRHRAGTRYRLLETLHDYARGTEPATSTRTRSALVTSPTTWPWSTMRMTCARPTPGRWRRHPRHGVGQPPRRSQLGGRDEGRRSLPRHRRADWPPMPSGGTDEREMWATMSESVEGPSTSATSHGWVANWALLAGDVDRALELALRGVEGAREPDDPDVTQWAVVASVRIRDG